MRRISARTWRQWKTMGRILPRKMRAMSKELTEIGNYDQPTAGYVGWICSGKWVVFIGLDGLVSQPYPVD